MASEFAHLDDRPCWYCGKPQANGVCFVVEHQTPLSRGGTDTGNNMVMACAKCNIHKGDLTVEECRIVCGGQPFRGE